MAEGYSPSSCLSGFMPKSKLLHNPEIQYGFILKLSHHGGKNNRPGGLKNLISSSQDYCAQQFFSEAMFLPVNGLT